MKSIFITVLLAIVLSPIAKAQFNMKVGYNIGYTKMDAVNDMFKLYDSRTQYDDKLSKIGFLNGVELGLRYRFYSTSAELGMSILNSSPKAVGELNEKKVENKWKISANNYHFSLTQHYKMIGIGAEISQQRFLLKNKNPISETFTEVSKERNWAGKVFIQFEAPSSNVSFVIRPYYQFSLDSYDVSNVAKQLEVTYDADTKDKLGIFGISVLIFNGPQYY